MKLDANIEEALARAYYDPLFFVLWAFPWGETPETSIVPLPEPWASKYPGCKYGPDKWACEMLDDIGEQVRKNAFDGVHAVPPLRYAVASGHGIGKAVCVDMIVDTPNGKRRWGDLEVGDTLWGPDGKPTAVVAIPYRGVRPCYRVTFNDGSSTVVSGEHLWTVEDRRYAYNTKKCKVVTLSTEELLDSGLEVSPSKKLPRWGLPRHSPVELPDATLPVDPYILGCWLGDGSKGEASLCTDEPETLQRIAELNVEMTDCHTSVRPGCKAKKVYLRGVRSAFRTLDVFQLGSHERYIPEVYKYASVEQRAELFRGLIDSDGEVDKPRMIIFSSASRRLAEDFVWLSRSLGGKAKIYEKPKQSFRYENGEKILAKPSWRCRAVMPHGFKVCYSRKKASRLDGQAPMKPACYQRWITGIEPVGERECMCVTVDRDDGLFLANDFIVTHNSAITAWLTVWILATRPNSKGVVTANTANQLKTKTFAEISKWLKRSLVRDMFDINAESITSRESPESWRVDAQTCREENSEAFAGQHAASSTSFYIVDEASNVPEVIWDVCMGGLTDGEPMMFVFGNPTRNTGRFRECFGKRRAQWRTRQIDSRDVFVTNKQQMEEWRKEYGEDSDFFRVRVRGVFPNTSSMQFIPTSLVEEAAKREIANNTATAAIIGVDVARFGDDDSVIYTRIGRGWLPIKRYHGLSTTQLVSKVKMAYELVRSLGFPRDRIYIHVDEGGVGGGPKDMLKDDGYPVRGIGFGEGADEKDLYARKREEMWGRMKLWLADGGSIPNDQGLIDDLTSPEYDILPGGQVKLESKKDMKKRGLASPDAADALALTFAYKIQEYLPLAEIERRNARGSRSIDPFACLGGG